MPGTRRRTVLAMTDPVTLLPAEHMALTVASAMVKRGENPGINTSAMLVAALERLERGGEWHEAYGPQPEATDG